jgi:SPX domain protein involved in polyphosphate accumulation
MLIVQDLQTKQRHWESTRRRTNSSVRVQPGIIIMKFGEQLRTSTIKEYEWYYIDYNGLKAQLKTEWETRPSKESPKGKRREWTEEDEGIFIDRMEKELDKIHTKQKVKAIEIGRRIGSAQKEVDEVVSRLDSRGPVGRDGSDGNDSDAPTEEEFMMLEEDLSDIIADVHDLAKFVQLNYTGFQKIIKKHDVSNSSPGRSRLLTTETETNRLDAEAGLRNEAEGQALL